MTRSEQVNELATALAKAQADMTGAKKDSTNPHFRSSYADLASVREASMPALNKHGLSAVQFPRLTHDGSEMWLVEVETTILHTSGQWISDTLAVPVTKVDAQGVGSAITYARRYALGAVCGVAPEDDDGEAAVGRTDFSKAAPPSGAMETITIKVKNITQRDMGRWTKYTVLGDDGQAYGSKNKADAATAKMAQEAGTPVEIAYIKTQYGRDIKSIAEAVEPVI